MPDYSFITQAAQQPSAINTIGGLMNIANTAQSIRGQNIQNTQNQMYLDQRQAASALLQDPQFLSSVSGQNGMIDLQKASPAIMKVAPLVGGEVIQHLAAANQQVASAQKSLLSLSNDQRTAVAQQMTADANNPDSTPASIIGGLQGLVKEIPQLGPAVDFYVQHNLLPNMKNPAVLKRNLLEGARSVMSMSEQEVPAAAQQNVGMTPSGQPFVQEKDIAGKASVSSVPGASAPFFMPAGETPQDLAYSLSIRNDANQAASTVPNQQFNTNNIIRYAQNADTGTGSQFLNNLKGQFAGVPWSSNAADNYNMLGHMIALQTTSLANSSGLNTSNEARALAQESTSNKDWTKGAVIQSARIMRGLSTGAELYNEGMTNYYNNAVEKEGASKGAFSPRDFRTKWSKVANVNSFLLYDALKNKDADPDGLKSIVNHLGGPKSAEYKQAVSDIDKMRKLIYGK